MQISTQFFVSEDFDRSITYYDMLDNHSRSSPDIVRSLHLSVKPLILFDSTTLYSLGSNIPKWIFFLFVVNACTTPPACSNKQRKLIRLAIPIDIWGKYYSFQKKYTRRKTFAANQKPWSWCVVHSLYPITHTFFEIDCLKFLSHYVRHMFSQDHGEPSDSVNEWGEETQ